jgi:RecT family
VQLMTGINGFHAIANANEAYDGMESGLIDQEGSYVTQAYPKNDFIGAWCKVYRKDRRMPLEGVAMLNEYDKNQGNWQKMKRVMIMKCAESVALRKAFPQQLNGLYTAEEMPTEYSATVADVKPADQIVVAESSAEKASYAYEIWQLDEKKQGAAQRYLEENGAQFDEESSCWISSKPLKRLEQYQKEM